jgi:hypothetical protein
MMWLCVCKLHGGAVDVTEWITQDGADQMACETEQEWRRKKKRAACVVVPAEGTDDMPRQAAAVAEILFDEATDD